MIFVKHLILSRTTDYYRNYHYGIHNQTYHWITSWLTNRKQLVTVDGVASKWVPVKSGVPQGILLGPIMFLIYINDIEENELSTLKLFADDCILFQLPVIVINFRKILTVANEL